LPLFYHNQSKISCPHLLAVVGLLDRLYSIASNIRAAEGMHFHSFRGEWKVHMHVSMLRVHAVCEGIPMSCSSQRKYYRN